MGHSFTPYLHEPSSASSAPDSPCGDGPVTQRLGVTPASVPAAKAGPASVPRIRGYEILAVVGSGGMGIVYKARHRDLQRTVAIKTLRGADWSDREFRDRIQAEAMAVARLQHPNIIQVFEVGVVESTPGDPAPCPFIALEFVDGGSLAQRVGKPQPARESAEMVARLARAVHSAHHLGVVHRDLKPANVLLTRDGEPKVADFGLAKQIGSERDANGRFLTQAGTAVGTPEYMAPEQASGDPPTPAVDIYALGVILYELLAARVPFQAAHPLDTMEMVRHRDPVAPRRLVPTIPRDLDTICLKCLQKDPHRRYATAEELADDLDRFLNHRPVQARRITNTERFGRWCRRNPQAALSLFGVLGMFLVAFALVTVSYVRAETARKLAVRRGQEAERREEAERWERYRANILSAGACQVYNAGAARRALDDAPEEHRNWEWRHYQRRLDMAEHVIASGEEHVGDALVTGDGRFAMLCGHELHLLDSLARRSVYSIPSPVGVTWPVLSRDGKTIVVVNQTFEIVIHDVDAKAIRATLQGHSDTVNSLALVDDDRKILSASHDGSVRIWDARTGALIRTHHIPRDRFRGINPIPAGPVFGMPSQDRKTIELRDLVTGEKRNELAGHTDAIHNAVFESDGRRAVVIEGLPGSTLRLWDVPNARTIATMSGHANTVHGVAFTGDGKRIATASRDQTVGLWDGKTGSRIGLLKGHMGAVLNVAFSPDGKRLVSTSVDHTMRLWDAENGESLGVMHGHTRDVLCVAFLADNSTVVSSSADGTVRTWNSKAIEANGILRGHKWFVYGVAFHPDGKRIASASWDFTARIWDTTGTRPPLILPHGNSYVTSAAFDPTGAILATRARDAVRLWNAESGEELCRWNAPGDSWRDSRVAFSPDASMVAAGCANREVRIWDVRTRTEIAVLHGHADEVRDVAFSPDGRWLATGGHDRDCNVRIWDLKTMKQAHVLTGHRACVYSLAFRRQGALLASGSPDGDIRLWDTETWQEAGVLKIGAIAYGLCFSPDGSRLACACSHNSIRFWDTRTRQEVAELRGHDSYVHQVAFSPDGSRLVSGSGDGTVRLWDTLSPLERASKKE